MPGKKEKTMKRSNLVLLGVLLLVGHSLIFAQDRIVESTPLPTSGTRATLSVTDLTGGVTPTDLAQNLLGGGVAISNLVYTGANVAAGVYSGGTGAGISLNEGIILSSGAASLAKGPNNDSGASRNNGLPGDADLNTLVGSAGTFDACVLEFDFIPDTANLQFVFVMGSEEYEEYLQYHDVFGFFLDGVNIALIPGTTIPISIGTINHTTIHSSYYIRNTSAIYDIQCDGFTVPIPINVTVTPGVSHHIKLAVADYMDRVLDTWIFLQGGTFISGYNVLVDSDPQGARIFKDGVDTGLNTPNAISQTTGSTSVYRVEMAAYAFTPPTITVPNITSNQSIFFQEYDETLPVEMSSFTATTSAAGFVALRWTTESETDMLGYRVYRSETEQVAEAIMITPVLIGATNTSSQAIYQHEDHEVEINTTYYYWLEGVDFNVSQFYGPVSVTVTGQDTPDIPIQNLLGNSYPNPFKDGTSFTVDIKTGDHGTVGIYNSIGQKVKAFEIGEGSREIFWDGCDQYGNRCASGVYLYKLSTQSQNVTKKMLIVK